jgi:excisionase family DNA binding protein
MPSPTFLTYAEAAERLGVTEHWLRQAVRKKRVAHSRLSDRVIRFTPEDIDAIREAARVNPETTPTKSGPTPSRRRAG